MCLAKSNGFASPGLFDYHGIADPDVFAFDFILVMQRCAPNRASAYEHRLQHRHRRENSGAPNLNHDVVEARLHAFGLVFVRNGPTWRLRGEPETFALSK